VVSGTRYADLEARAGNLEAENTELQSRLDSFLTRIEAADAEYADLASDYDALLGKQMDAQAENSRLRLELAVNYHGL